MGWPKKDDMRLYRDKDKSYFLLFTCNGQWQGNYDALVNVYDGPSPSLASSVVSRYYLYSKRPKRVEWSELPEEWKAAFRVKLGEDFSPSETKGLWKLPSTSNQKV